MWHSSRTRLALAAVLLATAFLSAQNATTQANGQVNTQAGAQAANPLPNPYQPGEDFFKLPAGQKLGSAPGIHVDPDGSSIWTFDRCGAEDCYGSNLAPIHKFDAAGNVVKSFGAGMFLRPHGMYVHSDGTVWVTDGEGPDGKNPLRDGKGQQVFKFSPDGKLLMTLGTAGVAGDGPDNFNMPSSVVVAPNGDIFAGDGHGGKSNSRIMKFSKDGKFIKTWGKKGDGPGEFEEPHSLAIDSRGRLFVGDTGNYRIEIFDQDGKFLEEWKQFGRPSGLYIDKNDTLYVADSSDPKTHPGFERGIKIGSAKDGRLLAFIPDPGGSYEGVTADAHGNVFGAATNGKVSKKYAKK